MQNRKHEKGAALLAVMLLAALLLAVLASYFVLTGFGRSTTRHTMDATRGHYAAEAGLNMRLDQVRQRFNDFEQPGGTSPSHAQGEVPCQGYDLGSGDYGCSSSKFSGREVLTYISEPPGSPTNIIIPRGELYQNLRATQHSYDVRAVAVGSESFAEAILDMRVRSRLVPMFQFAVFYNKDLEILPGPDMFFEGPVHSNRSLYLDAGTSLTVNGQISSAEKLYVGRKNNDSCAGGRVAVFDPSAATDLPSCGMNRMELTSADLGAWHGMIQTGIDPVQVPPPAAFSPTPGESYWDKADLRIMLTLGGGAPAIEVRDPTGALDAVNTAALNGCAGAVSTTTSFHNHREDTDIRMLDVDVQGLLDCLHVENGIMGGKALDDATQGGLVWYLGVDGPGSNVVNNYGVRVFNGADLDSTAALAPEIRGLTVVTNQAVYIQGDYNAVDKKPAAFLADSLNVLSNAWSDANSGDVLASRIASDTTIQAAFLSGTDTTGGLEGAAGQDIDNYNGGVENYPRFHEDWATRTLTYRGSFVSLEQPEHVDGRWGDQSYSPPDRDWRYDTDFNDPSNLPPMTPRFVHVVQGLFAKSFEL